MQNKFSISSNIIGIPRAVSYYYNYPFYYGFFKGLGFDAVLSDKTTSKIINDGSKYLVSDTCLPVKVFAGHVINLLSKGCDKIFIPALQAAAYKVNYCTKIRGLPDIIRNVIDVPFTIIEPVLDKTNNINFKDFCFDAANQLGVSDKEIINAAIQSGWAMYDNFRQMTAAGVPFEKALKLALNNETAEKPAEIIKPLSAAVIAHGYNLFDERISMRLISKLENMGIKVYTGLNVSVQDAENAVRSLGMVQYWANEPDLTGAAAYFMLHKKVDGIIALSAFGCGPDSLIVNELQYRAEEIKLPILHLTIDEHTGEAGFLTRLEAFADMLMRTKRKRLEKSNVKLLNSSGLENQNIAIKKENQV